MAEVTNYIDRLVAELCPDGVEYRPLGEICAIRAGGDLPESYVKGQKEPSDLYPYPIYSNGSEEKALYGYASTYRTEGPAVTVSARGTIGYHTVRYGKFTPIVRLITLKPSIENLDIKFLDYCLGVIDISHSGGSIPQLTVPNLKKMEIPVPPMEIQEAIVEILDKFTNLEAELEAELEARTLQYEYYRDSLFEALDCPRVPLGSLGIRNKGITITASKMRTLEPGNKDVRIFAAGSTFVDTDSSFIPDKGILEGPAIIVKSRGHIGFEYYEGKFTHKNELWSYSLTSDRVEQKFIYYYLLTQAYSLHELARGKSVKLPQLAVKDTDELLVPVPSLEEQQRIVDILDRFDALTSSLSEGLPAELAARRSQYEYYRDQLLTFPRKGDNQ